MQLHLRISALSMGIPGDTVVMNLTANAGDKGDTGLIPGSGRFPGGGNGNSLQYSCGEKSHGQRNQAGYSLWGRQESDMVEHTHMTLSIAVIM